MPADPRDSTVVGPPEDEPDPRWSAVLRSLSDDLSAERHAEFSAAALELLERSRGPGRYQVEGEVARGGQGTVLRVWDESLSRELAMKVMLPGRVFHSADRPLSPRELGRFLEEAQITGQLDHPGIVPVHELGLDEDGRPYFTMKLVKGESLASVFEKVRDGQEGWTRMRAVGLLLRVCEAMAYAHSKGVTHRDLKPANIMVGRFGEVFVMDWGLARVESAPSSWDEVAGGETELACQAGDSPSIGKTTDGRIIGTPWYMSPEQARGRREGIGPHCDIYAIGAILYELLSGDPPYYDEAHERPTLAVVNAILMGPPTPVHYISPNVTSDLIATCERAMAPRVEDRYESVMLLAEDLRACMEVPKTRNLSRLRKDAVERVRKGHARNSILIVLGVLLSLAVIAQSLTWKNRADLRAYAHQKLRIEAEEQLALALAREAKLGAFQLEAIQLRGFLDQTFADEALESLARSAPGPDGYWPPRGVVPLRDEAWLEAATATYRQRLDKDPGDEQARLHLAAAAVDHGDRESALSLLEQELGSAGARRLALQGHLLWQGGDYERASRAYEAALKQGPADVSLRFDLGRVYLAQGSSASAIRAFGIVVSQWPDSQEARRMLGAAYLQAKLWGEAEAVLRKVVSRDPQSGRAQVLLARAYLGLHQERAAINAIQAALPYAAGELSQAERSEWNATLAYLLLENGRPRDGLYALERSLSGAEYPDSAEVLRLLDDELLGGFVSGAFETSIDERFAIAGLCHDEGLFESATAIYRSAFDESGRFPRLREGHGFRAALSAAHVVGSRQAGAELLHEEAVRWLEVEFGAWERALESGHVDEEDMRLALLQWRAVEELGRLQGKDDLFQEIKLWLAGTARKQPDPR